MAGLGGETKHTSYRPQKRGRNIWIAALNAVTWSIWIERTRGIFEAKGRLVRNFEQHYVYILGFLVQQRKSLEEYTCFYNFASNILP